MPVFLRSSGVDELLNETPVYAGFTQYIGDQLTHYVGDDFSDPDAMYRDQRAIRTVVNFIAHNCAHVEMLPFKLDSNGEREQVRTPRARALLASPDRHATQYEFLRDQYKDLLLWEKFAAAKIRNTDGELVITRIPPRTFQFERYGGRPVGIRIGDDRLDLDKFLWLDGYPAAAGAPMAHLADLLLEEHESSRFRADLWRRGAKVGGVIQRPAEAPDWSPAARKRFREQIDTKYTGSSATTAGGVMLLEDGMTYAPLDHMSARDAQQIEARKLSIAEVAAAYQVPPVFVGVLDNANYSNVKAYRGMLYSDVLGPLFKQVQQAWTLRVAVEMPGVDEFEHDIGEKVQLPFEEQLAALQSAAGQPILTVAEARKRVRQPYLPGTNKLAKPEKPAAPAPAPKPPEDDRDRIDRDEGTTTTSQEASNNE